LLLNPVFSWPCASQLGLHYSSNNTESKLDLTECDSVMRQQWHNWPQRHHLRWAIQPCHSVPPGHSRCTSI